MIPSYHSYHLHWFAEQHRNDLLRDAERFRLIRQWRVLAALTTPSVSESLHVTIGAILIRAGRFLRGYPHPTLGHSIHN